ncbi:flavin reductase family protein [Adlercreutzia murintestinalis]|uniref:flavin reductase family protein n=1 Tax=Adlercreutzia murintestinalis TaxID=2941325 RepID=UPI00203D9D03|nr:flavin reductase family protein [Adlercreutzia murintestinalis]
MEKTIDVQAFHSLTYGLFVIASKLPDGRKVGCIANTFQQVASEPPQASVALNKDNITTKAIIDAGRFTASVLSEEATMELIGVFGFHNSLEREKFAAMDHDVDASHLPFLKQQCMATFSVRVEQAVDVGTHLLLIGPIEEAHVLCDATPLTYAYYHTVLRGKRVNSQKVCPEWPTIPRSRWENHG